MEGATAPELVRSASRDKEQEAALVSAMVELVRLSRSGATRRIASATRGLVAGEGGGDGQRRDGSERGASTSTAEGVREDWWVEWAAAAVRTVYRGVTTGLGEQTLGEEFCDVVQTDMDGVPVPRPAKRLASILLHGGRWDNGKSSARGWAGCQGSACRVSWTASASSASHEDAFDCILLQCRRFRRAYATNHVTSCCFCLILNLISHDYIRRLCISHLAHACGFRHRVDALTNPARARRFLPSPVRNSPSVRPSVRPCVVVRLRSRSSDSSGCGTFMPARRIQTRSAGAT